MIEQAINRILSLAHTPLEERVTEILKRTYSDIDLKPILEPMPDTLKIQTLTGLSDYLHSEFDDHNISAPRDIMIMVISPVNVQVIGKLVGSFKQRPLIISATASVPDFRFGVHIEIESFIIGLQSKFLSTNDRERLLKIVGNLCHEEKIKGDDDGVTQRVTLKKGLAGTMEEVGVQNPFHLQPFRTFTEVPQPISPFILRVEGGQAGFSAGLYEADGGAWMNEARDNIKMWLGNAIPGALIVA